MRKQEAFEQEVTQASVWRHALPTPSSSFIFLFLCTTKDRDTLYTDDHITALSSSTYTLTLTPTSVLYLSFSLFTDEGQYESITRSVAHSKLPPSPGNNSPLTVTVRNVFFGPEHLKKPGKLRKHVQRTFPSPSTTAVKAKQMSVTSLWAP